MKTLILTDGTYEKLLAALRESDLGSELLATMTAPEVQLPEGRELVKLARSGGGPPEVIARACAYRDAGRQAAADTREQVEDLIRRTHEAGVGATVLSRWFDLTRSRVSEIIE
jgi:hypothetical protein